MRRHLIIALLPILFTGMAGAQQTGAEKVLVVGLDGADWDVINPLIERGEMPNLAELKENGKHGNLTTTLPIESPVAWTSMSTGTTPGKHGIYGFIHRKGDRFVPTTADDVRRERVWDRVGEEGEVVVVNVPQTFPPREVNGYMVSGYLSIEDAGYTQPPELQEELEETVYRIEALDDEFEKGRKDEFLQDLNVTVEKRTETTISLLNRSDWKLGWVVYTGLDRLQHYFWADMESGGKYSDAVEDHYRRLDAELGELREAAGENTTVIVVSDHGFGPLDRNVYLNTWLRKEGYMELEGGESTGFLASIGFTQQNLVDTLSGLGLLQPVKGFFELLGFNPGRELPNPELSDIDLENSEAYAGNFGGKIYITDSVEDREELLRELERKLKEIEDPDTGERIFAEVYRKEEIYTGEMENAPDLVLEPDGPYRAVGFLGHSRVVKKPPKKTGTHRRDGIYVIEGGEGREDGDIVDVAPTVLEALGLEVPGGMDGESLLDG